MNALEEKSKSSRNTKLWVELLIKPLLLCFLFIMAELEGEWPLYLEAVKNIIPLFFAAGHGNYARWELYYFCSMETLPDNVHSHFMKREHTIQLSPTPGSGIWSHIGIKVSYNQIGKAAAEFMGQSTNMETVKVCPYSLKAWCEVVECLEVMENESSTDSLHKCLTRKVQCVLAIRNRN